MTPQLSISAQLLGSAAARHGLAVAGVLCADDARAVLAEQRPALAAWQENGWAGDMAYMRRPAELLTGLEHLLPDFSSVITFVVPYSTAEEIPRLEGPCPAGFGRVARYAWGRDYHRVLPKRLKRFIQSIHTHLGEPEGMRWRLFSDAVPLLERALGAGARLGFIGKNTMLIRPGAGSFSFLCEVIWNVTVTDVAVPDSAGSCGSCSRCLIACPTNALRGPGKLDARRCISYLTIEKRGAFDSWEQQALGEWLFGCDICQSVCPFNHQGIETEPPDAFSAESGCGPLLELSSLLAVRTREEFTARFAGTPLMRPGREGLLRNAASVAANTRAYCSVAALAEACREDLSELVRAEAAAAMERLLEDSEGIDRRRLESALAAREACRDKGGAV